MPPVVMKPAAVGRAEQRRHHPRRPRARAGSVPVSDSSAHSTKNVPWASASTRRLIGWGVPGVGDREVALHVPDRSPARRARSRAGPRRRGLRDPGTARTAGTGCDAGAASLPNSVATVRLWAITLMGVVEPTATIPPRPRFRGDQVFPMAVTGAPRTNGFLFADLRDYTRYVESYGDQAAAAPPREVSALVRDAVASSAEPRSRPRATASTSCSPRRAAPSDAGSPSSVQRQKVRIGWRAHPGRRRHPRWRDGRDPRGLRGLGRERGGASVGQARPGELLVTDTVRGSDPNVPARPLRIRGRRQLKGISEPLALYAVLAGSAPAPARTRPFGSRLPLVAAAGGLVTKDPG